MREFQISIDIHAPPERVWPIMADLERWSEWTPSISGIEVLDGKPAGLGSQVRVRQPKLLPATFTITEWKPDRGFKWVSHSLGLVAVGNHVIEPGQTGSKVTLTLRFLGLLGGLAGFLGRNLIFRYIQLEASGLKARSESDLASP